MDEWHRHPHHSEGEYYLVPFRGAGAAKPQVRLAPLREEWPHLKCARPLFLRVNLGSFAGEGSRVSSVLVVLRLGKRCSASSVPASLLGSRYPFPSLGKVGGPQVRPASFPSLPCGVRRMREKGGRVSCILVALLLQGGGREPFLKCTRGSSAGC